MTDPKRITLPGPGSQPSHPAPEPPSDAHATAVLGTLPSGTPVERSAPPDEPEERPGFNPFKFQRITVPPGLRADMIRWSREGKAEQLPTQTLPPSEIDEADLGEASAESDDGEPGDDEGSMTPVGGSSAPKLPLRSVRGFALAAGLVILPLAVLGLASALRRQPSAPVTEPAPPTFGAPSENTPPTSRAVAPVVPAERATQAATATSQESSVSPLTSATPVSTTPPPSSKPARSETPIAARPTTAARSLPSAQPASTAVPNEHALDRPFSLPK